MQVFIIKLIVPEIITGNAKPNSSNALSTAKIAALAFNVSNTVSIKIKSAPPSINAFVASVYAITKSSKKILRKVRARGIRKSIKESDRVIWRLNRTQNKLLIQCFLVLKNMTLELWGDIG